MDDGATSRARAAAGAREQHGLATRGQLLGAGISASSAKRDVAAGRLERVHARVLRFPGAPRTWEQQLCAAVLAGGAGAVASHRSAARLWSLLDDAPTEISVPRGRLPRPNGVAVHRSGDLAPPWCTTRAGVPVTNPLRTLVDLGAVVPPHVVADALELALVRRLVSIRALEYLDRQNALVGIGWTVLRHT